MSLEYVCEVGFQITVSVVEMASSVERLGRYANCNGSSEGGSRSLMCLMTSFSKHLMMMLVSGTGDCTGKMLVDLEHLGTTAVLRDVEYVRENIS